MKRLLAVLLLLLVSSFLALAQDDGGNPNDPAVNENANACYEGGTMEGKCNIDWDGDGIVEDFEVTWAWECGWYAIRFEAGIFGPDDMPDRCTTTVNMPLNFSNCFTNSYVSFSYMGPEASLNNAFFFDRVDCTGYYYPSGNSVLVFANSQAEALAICDALGVVVYLNKLSQPPDDFNTPANMYGCIVF